MANEKRVTSRSGSSFMVDTSNEACEKFGFRHGDQVLLDTCNSRGEVIGVAPHPTRLKEDALWIVFENDDGKASIVTNPMNYLQLLGTASKPQGTASKSPQAIKISRPKKATFKPLSKKRFKCNQTGAVVKAWQVDGYARGYAARP